VIILNNKHEKTVDLEKLEKDIRTLYKENPMLIYCLRIYVDSLKNPHSPALSLFEKEEDLKYHL